MTRDTLLFFLLVGLVGYALERGAQDVARGGPGIGRAILGNRLFLFGHFERLDRDLYLLGAAVDLDHPPIDLLADGKALGPLLAAIARELRALDEGGEIAADDLDVEAALLHLGDLAGHHRAFLDVARGLHGIAFELLDPERNPLLLDIDIEHLGL